MQMGPSGFEAPRLPFLSAKEIASYMSMARLHNLVPSMALVLLGAWAGGGRRPDILLSPLVWAMAVASAGVTCASMMINDYFDWASGTDIINSPNKPLPAGHVTPDRAVLVASSLYVAVLIIACCMPSPALRAITALSAGATLLYTPVFKRITAVKNACVAAVIAAAPMSGALAAGAGMDALQRLVAPTAFSFTAIIFREVLMDVTDMEGDRAAGVRTLPVLLGGPLAVGIATALMVCGAAVGVVGLLGGAAGLAHPSLPQVACAALVVLQLSQLLSQIHTVYKSQFNQKEIDAVVMDCMKPIGLAFIILAAMS
eukprot:CAMPEP_0202867674 /NCGR_PEP_ID=MMETSP1391-20130828/9561_1 /ASSEMBLY_ACC=CAM_ASM_000867 /TAXON_ID=1034604 /ORGANISM="Chlamydomonas leiostraca, Strain SAG 11-49" /LENGTH=313 /DNA_ID=CAMNT_0049547737 /DNA_START=559 /DNA_END=1500 /DNA_ORIENTATION=+